MDIAVHQAKKKGLSHVIFDPSLNQDQSRRLTMAGELRRAIEGGDLSLYLQPKVEMTTDYAQLNPNPIAQQFDSIYDRELTRATGRTRK